MLPKLWEYILKVHLFPEHKVGAQHPQFVQRPTVDKIKSFQEVANGLIKIITYALKLMEQQKR